MVFAESWLDLSDTLSPTGEEAFAVCECLFSIVYMGLLAAQLAVIPSTSFGSNPTNRFDAFVTTILFVVAFFWCLPFVSVSRATLHRLTILRLLRLVARPEKCRGSSWSRHPSHGSSHVGGRRRPPILLRFFLERRGRAALRRKGLRDNPRLADNIRRRALRRIEFQRLRERLRAPLRHDRDGRALHGVHRDELRAVTGVSGLGCIYFVSFYVVGCLVAVNVFSAFVIDAFLSQYEEGRALRETPRRRRWIRVARGRRRACIVCIRHSARDDVYAMFLEGDGDKFDRRIVLSRRYGVTAWRAVRGLPRRLQAVLPNGF